jgi:hypothetical protein
VVVLIGGSAGRTSAAVELISPAAGRRAGDHERCGGAAVGGCEGGGETREGRADNAKNARR